MQNSYFHSFIIFKPRCPLAEDFISANGTQEPLNQQTNNCRILSQPCLSLSFCVHVCVSVHVCVYVYSVLADSLFVYCQTWVAAAVFCVRVGQAVNWKQLCVYAFGGCGQRQRQRGPFSGFA